MSRPPRIDMTMADTWMIPECASAAGRATIHHTTHLCISPPLPPRIPIPLPSQAPSSEGVQDLPIPITKKKPVRKRPRSSPGPELSKSSGLLQREQTALGSGARQ